MSLLSLAQLSEQIQKQPEGYQSLIDGYIEVCKEDERMFLKSIRTNVVYVIPALINAYVTSIPSVPITLSSAAPLMLIGTIFEVVHTGDNYLFTGVDNQGNLTANKFGSIFQEIMTGKEIISRMF